MTPFETILIGAIGTGIVGIAGFITWFAKLVIPKMFESWEKLVKAFDRIPETITRFETKLDQNTVLTLETKTKIDTFEKTLVDQRFKDLQDQIIQNNHYPESRRSISGGPNN